jgi:hypothetical protein
MTVLSVYLTCPWIDLPEGMRITYKPRVVRWDAIEDQTPIGAYQTEGREITALERLGLIPKSAWYSTRRGGKR